jgi:hypothetical protein
MDWDELDDVIEQFKQIAPLLLDELISDLEDIMENVRYEETRKIMHKNGSLFGKRKSEEFIRYLYARLKNKKPRLTLEQLFKIR